ncbi:hypothetical protein R3W88_005286 [Solanum pinnatisectum]|uniref:Uncharacterized protein n=1 Tax=Solanum pinnatisectum TaxID=50273 RepID=A0AAV9KD18_9SOLN|nr:hypothetical protein R3W88_005286 [Solanum pinnatisectum]
MIFMSFSFSIRGYSRGDDLFPLYQNRVGNNGVAVIGFTGGGIWKFKFDVVNSVGGDFDVYEDLAACVGPLISLSQKGDATFDEVYTQVALLSDNRAMEWTKRRIAELIGEPNLPRRMVLRNIFLVTINTFLNILSRELLSLSSILFLNIEYSELRDKFSLALKN